MGATDAPRVDRSGRRLRPVYVAYAGSAALEWALWVGVLVDAYDRGGSTTAGVASILLLVPAVLVAPRAGRVADGSRPQRAVTIVFAIQAVSLAMAAVLAGLHAPVAVVVIASSLAINAVTFVRPAFSVIVPGLVASPTALVSANLSLGNIGSVSVLVGPLVASALVALGGASLVFTGCAVIAAVCVVAMLPLAHRERPESLDANGQQPRARMVDLYRLGRRMAAHRGSVALLTVLGAQFALVGGLDLLYVNLAFGVLHLGGSGPGYLSGAFGFGAVVGGVLTTVIVGRSKLAPTLIASLAVIAVAMLALGAWTTLAVALVMIPLAGVTRTVLDVGGRMLLQRSAPQDVLASVFALVEVLAGIGTLIGSVLVQVLIALSGVRAGLVALAAFFAVIVVVTASGLRTVDEADAPVVQIRLLRAVPLFAPLPGPALETLARTSQFVDVAAGDTVVAEGEVGDRYYVVVEGSLDVSIESGHVRTLQRGQGLGEIALLADIPRTATATATMATTVLAVDRDDFLGAVVGHDASARVAWSIARQMYPLEPLLGAQHDRGFET